MKIAFIGLGAMGLPMVRNLLDAGHAVRVNDVRSDAKQALPASTWADTPAAAACDADVVFTCLPGPAQVDEVASGESGLLAGMAEGACWFDFTTNAPTNIRRLHDTFARRRITVLDAPISGGPSGAQSRMLTFWVGGDRRAFDAHTSLLTTMGNTPIHVGPIGSGCIVKLVHNCAGTLVQQSLAEAFALGVKAGVDPATLYTALREGTYGRVRTFDRLPEKFLSGVYDPPSFSLRLAGKDMLLVLGLASEADVPMPIGEMVMADIAECIRRGWDERDARIAMSLKEERASVSVRIPQEKLRDIAMQK